MQSLQSNPHHHLVRFKCCQQHTADAMCKYKEESSYGVSFQGVNVIELLLFWTVDAHQYWEIGRGEAVMHIAVCGPT